MLNVETVTVTLPYHEEFLQHTVRFYLCEYYSEMIAK